MKGLTSYHSQPMKSSVNPGWRHAFISLMIVAYFIIATAQMVPEGAAYDFAFSEVEPVVLLFGLKQRWNLFAPDIRHMNQYSTCVVTMKDGTDRLYEWPRDRQSNFLEGFSRMRYRHFETNCWEAPKYAKLRQFGARFVARSNWSADNPPEFVRLIFNGRDIPEFEAHFQKQDDLSDWGYRKQTTFPYWVGKEDSI